MTTAKRHGKKGSGDVEIQLDDGSMVRLSAYEVRLAYRSLYSVTPAKKRAHVEESEVQRSLTSSGVPI